MRWEPMVAPSVLITVLPTVVHRHLNHVMYAVSCRFPRLMVPPPSFRRLHASRAIPAFHGIVSRERSMSPYVTSKRVSHRACNRAAADFPMGFRRVGPLRIVSRTTAAVGALLSSHACLNHHISPTGWLTALWVPTPWVPRMRRKEGFMVVCDGGLPAFGGRLAGRPERRRLDGRPSGRDVHVGPARPSDSTLRVAACPDGGLKGSMWLLRAGVSGACGRGAVSCADALKGLLWGLPVLAGIRGRELRTGRFLPSRHWEHMLPM